MMVEVVVKNPADIRTIIAATDPVTFEDDYTVVILKVWYEELSEPVPTLATLYDGERHTAELYVRAMAGEYGPIKVMRGIKLAGGSPMLLLDSVDTTKATLLIAPPEGLPALAIPEDRKLIEHDHR